MSAVAVAKVRAVTEMIDDIFTIGGRISDDN